MKKYSLVWWYYTGATFRAQAVNSKRVARKLLSHLAYKLGYMFGTWVEDKNGDFNRINEAIKN